MENLKELKQNIVLNKLVGNIIASAVIDSDDVSVVLKRFFDSEKSEMDHDHSIHILVNSCVIKLNNTITIKLSVSVDNTFFSLPILNLVENDLNSYIDYDTDEVNNFIGKIDTIVKYIMTP